MKKILSIISILAITQHCYASITAWGPGSADKNISGGINFKNNALLLTGALDPSVTPVNAPKGSVYIQYGSSIGVFQKNDTGNTANWILLKAHLSATAPISYNGTSGVVSISQSSASTNGYLGSTDWSTFNNKQSAGSYETAISAGSASQYWRGDKTFQTLDSSSVPEVSNLYWTSSRFNTAFSAKSTGDLSEGSNLYHTDARARSAISGSSPLGYNSGSGVLSVQQSTSGQSGYLSSTDWSAFNAKEPAITAATTSKYYRGDKSFQTLDSAAVTESSNLYYTDARAKAAISSSSPLTYSSGVVGCQAVSGSQAGCLSSSNWTTFNNKIGSITYTPSTPSRTLNNNFTPSASDAVWVTYTIEITCTATLSGGQTGTVELRSDTNATPTTARSSISNSNSISLAIAITSSNTQRASVSYLVPANHNVRLVSSGTATISIVHQSEVAISAI